VTAQAPIATANVSHTGQRSQNCHAISAKAIIPMPPADAPVVSMTAARRALSPRAPEPTFLFWSLTMKAIPVGKIAGTARNSPPTFGPATYARRPVQVVTAPPIAKRNKWPDAVLSSIGPGSKRILTFLARPGRSSRPRRRGDATGLDIGPRLNGSRGGIRVSSTLRRSDAVLHRAS
jgi:hypothetical protein